MKVKCKVCGEVINSDDCEYHQPVYCKCGKAMLDEMDGSDLIRVGGDNIEILD